MAERCCQSGKLGIAIGRCGIDVSLDLQGIGNDGVLTYLLAIRLGLYATELQMTGEAGVWASSTGARLMSRLTDGVYIATTIILSSCGQLILKWRIGKFGSLPAGMFEKFKFLISLFGDPVIFSGLVAAVIAALAWMAALTKFELNFAYQFMSLNFVLVLLLSGWFLSEPISRQRIFGVVVIVLGTIIAARG